MKRFIKHPVIVLLVLVFIIVVLRVTNQRTKQPVEPASEITTIKPRETISNVWLNKYANNYIINVVGVKSENEMESYILRKDGTAEWLWIENDGTGNAAIRNKKTGYWSASEGKVLITIQGETENIAEGYTLHIANFVSNENPSRYLTIAK